jgi:hypothetical protein
MLPYTICTGQPEHQCACADRSWRAICKSSQHRHDARCNERQQNAYSNRSQRPGDPFTSLRQQLNVQRIGVGEQERQGDNQRDEQRTRPCIGGAPASDPRDRTCQPSQRWQQRQQDQRLPGNTDIPSQDEQKHAGDHTACQKPWTVRIIGEGSQIDPCDQKRRRTASQDRSSQTKHDIERRSKRPPRQPG